MTSELTTHLSKLDKIALNIRKSIIKSLTEAKSGHMGGSLGLTDVFTVLYFYVLNHDPCNPNSYDRDRLVLSVGHVTPALYATLAEVGYFPMDELATLRKLESRLQGHPGKEHGLPGIELSSGSLGQGLSVAVGMAIADKMDKNKKKVYCLLGDGELQEGSNWEAAMSANHYELNNLCAIIDRNRVQIDGKTEDVMKLEPLADKWEAFGWNVLKCDGNNIEELIHTFNLINETKKPSVIIAETIMGKGVKSIEGDYRWHGKAPTNKEAKQFLNELENE